MTAMTAITDKIRAARAARAERSPRAARATGRGLVAGLVVASVMLLAVAGWCGFQVYQDSQEEQRRQDILAAARQMTVNFTSLDHRTYERDSDNVLKNATGDFKEEFGAHTKELVTLVADNESVSEGQALEAGIVRQDADSARVLVVADSKVSNVSVPDGEVRNYRLQLDLVFQDGRWLTSGIEFVG